MTPVAGELVVCAGELIVDLRVLEVFRVLSFPGHFVDERKPRAIVIAMTFGTFRFFGHGKIIMEALMVPELLGNFDMAAETPGGKALGGMAFVAVGDER